MVIDDTSVGLNEETSFFFYFFFFLFFYGATNGQWVRREDLSTEGQGAMVHGPSLLNLVH